jgi:hypothetical protein
LRVGIGDLPMQQFGCGDGHGHDRLQNRVDSGMDRYSPGGTPKENTALSDQDKPAGRRTEPACLVTASVHPVAGKTDAAEDTEAG